MPVRQTALLHPVSSTLVNLMAKVQQPTLTRAVIKPDDGQQVVTASAVLPVVTQELFLGVLHFPLKVTLHYLEHALITAIVVVILQNLQGKHICPELTASVLILIHRTEITVGLSTLDDCLYPELCLVQHGLIA